MSMPERRKSSRSPSFLGGTITYNRDLWSADCLVKNLSETGARITGRNLPPLPDRFDLTIPQRKARYRVHVRWRDKDVIGVEFEHDYSNDTPVSEPKATASHAGRSVRVLRASVFGDDVDQSAVKDDEFPI